MTSPFLAQALSEDSGTLLNVISFFIAFVSILLATCWLVLPFILMGRMSSLQRAFEQAPDKRDAARLISELEAANQHLQKLVAQSAPAQPVASIAEATVPASPSAGQPADLFYYVRDGETKGPVTEVQLRTLLARGSITAETLAIRNGQQEWSNAGSILS